MVNKNTLRKVYLEKRQFLSNQEYSRRNQLLLEFFTQLIDLEKYDHIHIFLPIQRKNEVDTWPIVQYLHDLKKTLYTSRTLPDGQLEHLELKPNSTFSEDKWGIPCPQNAVVVKNPNLDLIFVPLITFDKLGHRIGYGKGYYDRFIKNYPDTHTLGLSLAPPLDDIKYTNEFDRVLDACIVPGHFYRTGISRLHLLESQPH